MFVQYNPNPVPHNRVGDCAVRAVSKALDQTWEQAYVGICLKGFEQADMPSANHIWGSYLKDFGFTRHVIPAENVDSYTVKDFAEDHPHGTYVLGLDGHVVCVKDGSWYDSFDSCDELVHYYWSKKEDL